MIRSACLGLPRIGQHRELSIGVSRFLCKELDEDGLLAIAKGVRDYNFTIQKQAKIDFISSNDFSFFDHVLDTTVLVGNIPRRYYWKGGKVPFDIYFMMTCGQQREKFYAQPMEIARWFNTHYLYIAPEFAEHTDFAYSDNKAILHYLEGKQRGIDSRPIFLGPISYLLSSKPPTEDVGSVNFTDLLEDILPIYAELFTNLKRLNVKHIQIDEPFLVADLTTEEQELYIECYSQLAKYAADKIKIHLTTSYGEIDKNLDIFLSLPVASLHLDLTYGTTQLSKVLSSLSDNISLSLGLVDANSVFCNDIQNSIDIVDRVVNKIGKDRVIVSPSSSLFLCPVDKYLEKDLKNHEIFPYLAFSKQKLEELYIITAAMNGSDDIQEKLMNNISLHKDLSDHVHNAQKRINHKASNIAKLAQNSSMRRSPFRVRNKIQQASLKLPLVPITLHDSLPLDSSIGDIKSTQNLERAISFAIESQEQALVDVVTTGEFERSNNAEYLAQHLCGVINTQAGYTQWYGHHVFRPPIIWDEPILETEPYINIAKYALSVAKKPLKIPMIGCISFVNSCFLHSAINRTAVTKICADIIMNEAIKLEQNNIKIIHINEHALLQYLPKCHSEYAPWFKDMIETFKLSCYKLLDKTQLHVQVAYSPFEETIEDLANIDADVLLLDSARSHGRVLNAFASYKYQNQIGCGVFDNHSDRIPNKAEIGLLIKKTLRHLDLQQLWIVPDGGFGHVTWENFKNILRAISAATLSVRKEYKEHLSE